MGVGSIPGRGGGCHLERHSRRQGYAPIAVADTTDLLAGSVIPDNRPLDCGSTRTRTESIEHDGLDMTIGSTIYIDDLVSHGSGNFPIRVERHGACGLRYDRATPKQRQTQQDGRQYLDCLGHGCHSLWATSRVDLCGLIPGFRPVKSIMRIDGRADGPVFLM